jgi:hypothetical protein
MFQSFKGDLMIFRIDLHSDEIPVQHHGSYAGGSGSHIYGGGWFKREGVLGAVWNILNFNG